MRTYNHITCGSDHTATHESSACDSGQIQSKVGMSKGSTHLVVLYLAMYTSEDCDR